MRETLSVILSAWSTAFVTLFFIYAVADMPPDPGLADFRARVIIFLFVGAVTGAGWLWHRHAMKRQQKDSDKIAL